jgi:hypothetical protein
MQMKRHDGTNKNVTTNSRFDRRLKVSQTPWREVLADGDITRVLEAVHAKNNNGERRLNTDMSTLYVAHDLHRHTKLVFGDGCGVCSMWSAEPPKPVRAIISEYPLHLVMFDLTTMPFPDEDGYSTSFSSLTISRNIRGEKLSQIRKQPLLLTISTTFSQCLTYPFRHVGTVTMGENSSIG